MCYITKFAFRYETLYSNDSVAVVQPISRDAAHLETVLVGQESQQVYAHLSRTLLKSNFRSQVHGGFLIAPFVWELPSAGDKASYVHI